MIYRVLLAVGLVASAVAPASAQVIGIPVVNNGAATGVSIGADVGFASNDYFGGGTAIGAHASAGIGFFGVSAMVSRFSPKSGDAIVAPGASATLRLLGGPLVPFRITMQAGVARWTYAGATDLHIPLSIGLSATIPNPAFAIKPWIAPRIDISHMSGPAVEGGFITNTGVHFGISGGIDVSLLNGISIRAAYDRVSVSGASPSIFSLGLGFTP